MRFILAVTGALLLFSIPTHASQSEAPGFDCANAKTTIETLICSDRELSSLDAQIGDAYNKARNNAPKGSTLRISLLNEQRQYLKSRLADCSIHGQSGLSKDQAEPLIACLKIRFSLKLKALQDTQDTEPQGVKTQNNSTTVATEPSATTALKAKAEQGDAVAQAKLGRLYFHQDNSVEAVKWYRKAADQGNPAGEAGLGTMYRFGFGDVPLDTAEAAKWFRKAADQGYADAQYELGALYSQGEGVKQDEAEAMKWYRKAADEGNPDAQFSLGVFYENGDGFTKNYDEAVKWYQKAADQGEAHAEKQLGILYSIGAGVPKDLKEAYFWFVIASATNRKEHPNMVEDDTEEFRDQIERSLTPEEANVIGSRAREWVKAHSAQASVDP